MAVGSGPGGGRGPIAPNGPVTGPGVGERGGAGRVTLQPGERVGMSTTRQDS
jgi:hypothetical protein